MTPHLRYDDVPWEEFVSVLNEQISGPGKKALLPESRLRDVRFMALRNRLGNAYLDLDPKKNRTFWLYLIQEEDLVRQTRHQFFLIHTDSDGAEDLLKIAQRFRVDLKGKQIETLFHVDARYGVVTGSSLEPLSRYGVKQRPGCFIQLVITQDPGHPLVSRMDGLDKEEREKYVQLFEKYNHISPVKPSFLKKMFSHATPEQSRTGWKYKLLADITGILSFRYHLFFQSVSLIYENVSEADREGCQLDKSRRSDLATTSHFFTTTEELLQ